MYPIHIKTREKKMLADVITPVSVYLKLRDRFVQSFLLESSDNHVAENGFSYICCSPMAYIRCTQNMVEQQMPNTAPEQRPLNDLKDDLANFMHAFTYSSQDGASMRTGLFGYISYDAAVSQPHANSDDIIPLAYYSLFQFIIALDHVKNECYIIEAYIDQPNDALFEEVASLVQQRNIPSYPFRGEAPLQALTTDEHYARMVSKGIAQCGTESLTHITLSRHYRYAYQGDDFQVYRVLRSMYPSPYLFYFDFGSFRLFGSPAESQVVVAAGKVSMEVLAGVLPRTGDDTTDANQAQQRAQCPAVEAEHHTLVKAVQQALQASCDEVHVANDKAVQFLSQTVHVGTHITGVLNKTSSLLDVLLGAFPAATVSGIPKKTAVASIAALESHARGVHGGTVGFIGIDNSIKHAVMKRSFVSMNGELIFQAIAQLNGHTEVARAIHDTQQQVNTLLSVINQAESL